MTAITPISTTRVSDLLASQRLIGQLDADQVDLQQLESQVSTGKRIVLPSDDPTGSAQAIGLNRLIQQNTQIQTNLDTNNSYLSASDTALSNMSDLLSSARATALSVEGNTADSSQLQTAAEQIGATIQQLVATGNQNFDGRYLFSGSQTGVVPFTTQGSYVAYNGNAETVSSYANINQLFATNVSGAEAFGTLSPPVSSTANLTPNVTADTNLADLNGGQGVAKGSIKISDGTHSSVIDLSGAATVGDVVAQIEAHPPAGRTVQVNITPTGLNVSLDAAGGGNLTISEVGGSTAAAQLGILSAGGVGTGPVVGAPLNPQLTTTTPLSQILGTYSTVNLTAAGSNNDLTIQANSRGAAYNGYSVQFIDDHTVTPGNETVNFDSAAKTITVDIASGLSTAKDVVSALNNNASFAADFTASLDPAQLNDNGSGPVTTALSGTSAGGSGVEFDQTSGLQITNGGQTYTIDTSGAKTVGDLLNLINGSGASMLAQINPSGTGIDVQSRLSGANFSIGENGGATATELGLRTMTGATPLSQLNQGLGVQAATSGDDFVVQRKDGYQIPVTIGNDQTVQDVIDQINNDPNNQDPATKVTAQLAASGNGIELTTSDTSTTAPFQVIAENGSQAAQDLGLIPAGQTQSSPSTVSGGTETITGADANPQQVDSVFNALIKLQTAIQNNDSTGMTQAVNLLDSASTQLNFARADVGAREQSIQAIQSSLATQQDDLQSSLSDDTDVDMATAITNLTAKETSFEASLQMTAQLSHLTLLNFL